MITEATPTQNTVSSEATSVVTLTPAEAVDQDIPVLRLRLKKPKTDKQVKWTTGTVDNEFLNKKKSKCCCIFEKKRLPTDESSDDDSDADECDHCHGHVEQRVRSKPSVVINVHKNLQDAGKDQNKSPPDDGSSADGLVIGE